MPADPFTLLCEHCGYTIEGLFACCSECGRPVAQSLPEARTGSPWQIRPRLGSLIATNWRAVRRPRALFSVVRLDVRSGVGLLTINLLAAAVLLIAPWSGVLLDDPVRQVQIGHTGQLLFATLVIIPAQILGLAAMLLVLTMLEWVGIQYFARRKGARLCRLAAWQVVAHASVGWIVAAGCILLSLALWRTLYLLPSFPRITAAVSRTEWGLIAIPGLGALVGLLVFETLVYIGVLRCRFANRPRAAA